MTPRPGGDSIPELVRAATGLDTLALYLDFVQGDFKEPKELSLPPESFASLNFFAPVAHLSRWTQFEAFMAEICRLGEGARYLTSVCTGSLILAAAGFVIGAMGIFTGQSWWRTVVVISAAFSGALYILFWNGRWQHMDAQGGIGILIDVAILAAVLIFRWPQFAF